MPKPIQSRIPIWLAGRDHLGAPPAMTARRRCHRISRTFSTDDVRAISICEIHQRESQGAGPFDIVHAGHTAGKSKRESADISSRRSLRQAQHGGTRLRCHGRQPSRTFARAWPPAHLKAGVTFTFPVILSERAAFFNSFQNFRMILSEAPLACIIRCAAAASEAGTTL